MLDGGGAPLSELLVRSNQKTNIEEIATLQHDASRRVKPKDRTRGISAHRAEASRRVKPKDRHRGSGDLTADASRRFQPKDRTQGRTAYYDFNSDA